MQQMTMVIYLSSTSSALVSKFVEHVLAITILHLVKYFSFSKSSIFSHLESHESNTKKNDEGATKSGEGVFQEDEGMTIMLCKHSLLMENWSSWGSVLSADNVNMGQIAVFDWNKIQIISW